MKKAKLLSALPAFIYSLIFFPHFGYTATYYIRPDGGTSEQCTGLVDAPYTGTGTGQSCAFNHIFEATGLKSYGTQIIQGGDTIIIKNGSYRIGRTEGIYDGSGCAPGASEQCVMKPLPSGPDANHPTRILGEGWDSGCTTQPELWATEKAKYVLDLTNTSNIEIQCLEITDHETCGVYYKKSRVGPEDGGPALACNLSGTPPLGDYGYYGIFSGVYDEPYNTSSNVLLKNLYIHGMGAQGINASHLTNWTLEDCKIDFNAKGGFNGDTSPSKGLNDEFSGTMRFTNTTIDWNGCIENWQQPRDPNALPQEACYDAENGGYGDGIGTGPIGNAQWVFENVSISHNTSDGLDLLYARDYPLSSVMITNSIFEGNVGNQIKLNQSALVINNKIVGNCNFFDNKPYKETELPTCRGGGAGLIIVMHDNNQHYILNNSFSGTSPSMFNITASGNETELGNESVYSINNLMIGLPKYNSLTENSDYYYFYTIDDMTGFLSSRWHAKNNLYFNTVRKRYDQCLEPGSICDKNPLVISTDEASDSYDLKLSKYNSPAIDAGVAPGTIIATNDHFFGDITIPLKDRFGATRIGQADIGMNEYSQPATIFQQKGEILLMRQN